MTAKQPTELNIRMYNVGFGDCFLLEFKTAAKTYTMLIDCGRLSGSAKVGPDFEKVVQRLINDLPKGTGGNPYVDIVVMTHRHRDHVHGFSKTALWRNVKAGEVWMPWTENPHDPTATGLRKQQDAAAKNALGALRAFGVSSGDAYELALNSISNSDAIATLNGLSDKPVQYLPEKNATTTTVRDRTNTVADDVLPVGVTVRILGPSHDPKVIARLNPPKGESYLRLAAAADGVDPEAEAPATIPAPWAEFWDQQDDALLADAFTSQLGMGPGEFKRLVDAVESGAQGDAENLAFDVDNALNGTSLVLLIEVGDQTLLFPGDAQWGTWDVILTTKEWEESLKTINFLKVGHHGSHNATPKTFVEGNHLHKATAMVSVAPTVNTSPGWKAIPKSDLLKALTDAGVTRLVRSDKAVPKGVVGIKQSADKFCIETTLKIGPRK